MKFYKNRHLLSNDFDEELPYRRHIESYYNMVRQ